MKQFFPQKNQPKPSSPIITLVLLTALALLLAWAPLGVPVRKTIQGGMIVPHHLLVKDWMERFYEEQGARYGIKNNGYSNIERIILLSPNHFGYGYDWIQSTDMFDVWPATLPPSAATLDGLSIEPTHFYREHGITAELPYLERFFWGAAILPITFKEGTPQAKLDALVEELIELQQRDPRKTLIVASIDFTHVEEEKYALENDNRTIEFLQSLSIAPSTDYRLQTTDFSLDTLRSLALTTNPVPLDGATAMDSPETLYVLLKLMDRAHKPNFTLWQRTSSASLIPGLPAEDNTSHIFGSFMGRSTP